MTQVDTKILENKGNTILKFRARRFCITLNNYTSDELTHLTQYFEKKNVSYIIGFEKGINNTPHLQIYIETKNAIWTTSLSKVNKRMHIEKSKGNRDSNIIYCSKGSDFISNFKHEIVFKHNIKNQIINNEYKNITWKNWQLRCINLLEGKPHNRKIYVFIDPDGNTGKSFLCKYLAIKHNDLIICDGKKDNIFNQVKTMLDELIIPKIILLDVPRSNKDFINYGTIEQLKNGLIYSGKYEGGRCVFPNPHVIIFTNSIPELDKMSLDRWELIHINLEEKKIQI